jgi:hypothetical protein
MVSGQHHAPAALPPGKETLVLIGRYDDSNWWIWEVVTFQNLSGGAEDNPANTESHRTKNRTRNLRNIDPQRFTLHNFPLPDTQNVLIRIQATSRSVTLQWKEKEGVEETAVNCGNRMVSCCSRPNSQHRIKHCSMASLTIIYQLHRLHNFQDRHGTKQLTRLLL